MRLRAHLVRAGICEQHHVARRRDHGPAGGAGRVSPGAAPRVRRAVRHVRVRHRVQLVHGVYGVPAVRAVVLLRAGARPQPARTAPAPLLALRRHHGACRGRGHGGAHPHRAVASGRQGHARGAGVARMQHGPGAQPSCGGRPVLHRHLARHHHAGEPARPDDFGPGSGRRRHVPGERGRRATRTHRRRRLRARYGHEPGIHARGHHLERVRARKLLHQPQRVRHPAGHDGACRRGPAGALAA